MAAVVEGNCAVEVPPPGSPGLADRLFALVLFPRPRIPHNASLPFF